MAVTGTPTNHFKAQRQKGNIRLKAQLHNVSLTFTNATDKITLPSSAVTAGFSVGELIGTNSANANNKGPWLIKSISGVGDVDIEVMTTTGAAVTLTDGTEAGLTIGTYLVKVLLMRSGFVFSQDDHATKTSLKATTGTFTPTFVSATKKVTRGAGSFITDGFVPNSKFWVTNTASNPGPFTIVTVSALEIVVNEVVVDEVGTGDEVMTANDELTTGNGYTQDTKLTGVITVGEDDANNRSDGTFPAVTWTAAVGSIGPTPGAILYDDMSPDDTIIGYIDFGAEQTATVGTTFNIAAGTIRGA